jgi:hypothetical protein
MREAIALGDVLARLWCDLEGESPRLRLLASRVREDEGVVPPQQIDLDGRDELRALRDGIDHLLAVADGRRMDAEVVATQAAYTYRIVPCMSCGRFEATIREPEGGCPGCGDTACWGKPVGKEFESFAAARAALGHASEDAARA